MRTAPLLLLVPFLLTGCAGRTIGAENVEIFEYAILGNPDAPVTLVEYSDYECPFCRKFTTEVLPQIKTAYIDTGLVRLVYKDYPLHIHEQAIAAAIATHCAGKQGAYYPYHDLLFERTKDISKENFTVWAAELELDTRAFDTCREDPAMEEIVMRSIREAKSNSVVGTPSFLINGTYVAGAQPYTVFERKFQEALNKEVSLPVESADALCTNDQSCGAPRAFPPYCSRTVSNEVCITTGTPSCAVPGTDESTCVMLIKEECTPCGRGEQCLDGICV